MSVAATKRFHAAGGIFDLLVVQALTAAGGGVKTTHQMLLQTAPGVGALPAAMNRGGSYVQVA